MTSRAFRSIALASVLALSTSAAGAVGYTSFTVFGDSLSDDGNLYARAGLPLSPPYSDGRVSNGPVWAEHVAERFSDAENYAFAFARALPADPNIPLPFNIPDLPEQIGLFALDTDRDLGARPIASLLFGANDIFFNGIPNLDPVGVGTAAANAVADGALALSGLGFGDFLIPNLPDIGQTPAFSLLRPEAKPLATAATLAFNATLAARVGELRAGGLNVVDLDLFGLFEDLLDNPAQYGVDDVAYPCLFPSPEAAAAFDQPLLCTGEAQDGRAFFDQVHPNRVIHSAIAGIVAAQVAPIPLPLPGLLLFAGIAGLAALRRRA